MISYRVVRSTCRLTTHYSSAVATQRRALSTTTRIYKEKWSVTEAKKLLGLTPDTQPTVKAVRLAYFAAAKRTHPDSTDEKSSSADDGGDDEGQAFRKITEAYELLLSSGDVDDTCESLITAKEEAEYRSACLNVLGIPAETVEESKADPAFRDWLNGNSNCAKWWRMFLANNGGLAQKLRPSAGLLGVAPRARRRRQTPCYS
mmetsp:Transcript_41929/g.82199  ORF Transcript_41929/g.82199 Transcript_41929/m.82199 type:complete len:203 (+) Transcript_41929:226-834(+)